MPLASKWYGPVMPQKTFKIDPVRTFASVMFIGSTAKLVYGDSSGRQEKNKAGVPKWAEQCAAEFRTRTARRCASC